LIVGDGNLSYSAQLAAQGVKVCGTIIDDEQEAFQKFGVQYQRSVNTIRNHGGQVVHGVDATRLQKTFGDRRFSVVRFNFPHPGHPQGTKEQEGNKWESRAHLMLIQQFLISAQELLASGGTIFLVVRKNPRVYDHLQVKAVIEEVGLKIRSESPFRAQYAMAFGDNRDAQAQRNERQGPTFGYQGWQYELQPVVGEPGPSTQPPPANEASPSPLDTNSRPIKKDSLPYPRRNQMHHDAWSHSCYAKGYHLAIKMYDHPDLHTKHTAKEAYLQILDLLEQNSTSNKQKKTMNNLLREWGPCYGLGVHQGKAQNLGPDQT